MKVGPRRVFCWVLGLCLALFGCSNSPYPEADDERKVLYLAYSEAPKTLDPQVAYSTVDHAIIGKVYDTLLEYHYLERPYRLIAGMAESVPSPEPLPGGQVRYRFRLREGLSFQEDECFVAFGHADRKRPVTARDVAFSLARIADPDVTSPVGDPFSNLLGFTKFRDALVARRKAEPSFSKLPVHEQYEAVGGIEGAQPEDDRTFVVTLQEPYPQILYWFAMNFSSPVPYEAVEYYTGEGGRESFAERAVGSGPYRLAIYDKQARILLEKNPDWYGVTRPEQKAPGAVFPELPPGANPAFAEAVGKPLPFLDRLDYRMEKERIPAFGKFIQGYYDMSGIASESFDKVVQEDALSKEMEALGMQLSKSVVPAVYYIGFNMDDPVVGAKGGERARALRQALSMATDVREFLRLFLNGRGLEARSPLPPGIFGYDPAYENPYRTPNLERARQILESAGLARGIDPATGKPVRLTFDVPDTSPEGRLRYLFWVEQWRRLGIDVVLDATNYNKFQEKVRDGAYQVFQWGWVADYPDPENFLFLLTTPMARSVSGGPNTANFKNEEYDRLFALMRTRDNDAERARIISDMRLLLERERPWIELFHPEDYALVHGWTKYVEPAGLSIPTSKYHDVVPSERRAKRKKWNEPVLWPAFALFVLGLLVVVPGIFTFYRERQ